MALNPLNTHYSMENPASVYDEEAMTALQLAGRTASKINEVVKAQNDLDQKVATTTKTINQRLDDQDNYLEAKIPDEVSREVEEHILGGTFDRAISEYANDLEARVDNLLESIPEGGTTLDAEVIDIRVDEYGNKHPNAGSAVRAQINRSTNLTKGMVYGEGVYAMPLNWTLNTSASAYVYETDPVAIPPDGVSVRVSESGPHYPNGVESHLMKRVYIGTMVNGSFVVDEELNAKYCFVNFTRNFAFIPYMRGVYFKVRAQLVGGGTGQITANNYQEYTWIPELVRAYTGKVKEGGNLLGCTPNTVVRTNDEKCYDIDSTVRGFWWKYCSIASPLPLQFVNRVSCNPDIWMTAKIYRFDPTTRQTEWKETKHFNQNAPTFGSECVIDFTEYGENYYAILVFGKCPIRNEYQTSGFNGSTTATANMTRAGLNLTDITNGVHVEWVGRVVKDNTTGGSPVVQKNMELLKNLTHKTVPAMYGDDPSETYNYILEMDRFAGAFYGGGYAMGTFFYNVAPVAYFTALLNPNSVAYGTEDPARSGYTYGIMCSAFVSLLHGYPLPLSTFDYRYNKTLPYFETRPLDLVNEFHCIKTHDILTQGAGYTGHSVLVTGVVNVGDIITAIQVMESASPGTKENIFWLHNGLPYYKANPEEWYQKAYDFLHITDTRYDMPIFNLAEWNVPYTDPQKVMCSRGYGSVYVKGKNSIILSVDPEVTEVTITLNGAVVGTFAVGDLSSESANGYNLMDITSKVGPGTVRIHNNLDDTVEEFHVIEPVGYVVEADLDGDQVRIQTNHPEQVKYINIKYRFIEGDSKGTTTNMTFAPDFDSNGVMYLPSVIDTEIGDLNLEYHNSYSDSDDFINLVFNTGYDTNTFAIDAQGDIFN